MKAGRLLPDLLTELGASASMDQELARMLERLLGLTGAVGGALAFRPGRADAVVVTATRAGMPDALSVWLRQRVAAHPVGGLRLTRVAPPGVGRTLVVLRAPLGSPRSPSGELTLVGRLGRAALPAGFPRDLGAAIDRVWRLHQRTVRIRVLNEIARLGISSEPLDDVFRAFAEGAATLVGFDSIGVSLIDAERGEFTVVDLPARSLHLGASRDGRLPLKGTLLAQVAESGAPLAVDDLAAATVPPRSREIFAARGYRAAILAPLVSRGGVIGAVTLVARQPGAFDGTDVEIVAELAQPLASAIEQRRLLDETRGWAEELAALYHTSRLITARLDLASVLETISRSVTVLIGGTGCGIGLLDEERRHLVHAAAHGVKSEEWRALSLPVGEGVIGRCAASGQPMRVDDIRTDPRSARCDADEREGIRSMLCVPLTVGGTPIGVISAFSTRPAAFGAHQQEVLGAFAEQAGIAIHNARLFEERARRARETRALLEAGRAVTASLDVQETIRVIMAEARGVLGVESCSLMTFDPATEELRAVASLDLPQEMVTKIRLREGEGIAGRAVSERQPVQSADLYSDPRVRYPDLARTSGFRSILAAPLRVGQRAIGAITVLRRDVHRFSADEEELLLAFADQAAIALEHARLYQQLEGMVAERTRELDTQKRFVEVVLETLPLGVFVLDAGLGVVRGNREGGRVLACGDLRGRSLGELVPPERGESLRAFLEGARAARRVESIEDEMVIAGETKILRLTAAPIEPAVEHLVFLVEDVTLAKRLERQMLLTERLSTAGRLAAGVAHELNNPLATIAGCAESLLARTREGVLARTPEIDDFRHYLGLIEEETYRCKEITGSLLQFVREPGSRRAPTDLNALVLKTIELLSHQSRFGGCRFAPEVDPELPAVTANEGQLRQVFLGIAANALEAMGSDGTLRIRSRRLREEIEVEFEDEGPGISDEILGRIFDPFFTTKPPGQGTGLGLAIAQGIVTDHGGRIEVTSRAGKGSIFRVVLPA